MPSQALRASSPKGGAIGRPDNFLLDVKSPIQRKKQCPAIQKSNSLTMDISPKLLPSVAGHYRL